MEGAVLLYNRMLADLAATRSPHVDSTRVEHFGHELNRWGDEMTANAEALQTWRLSEFWTRVLCLNPRLPGSAERFSGQWMALAIGSPRSILASEQAKELIKTREYRLKGGRARLHNPRALERWPGASGLGRLTYRWGNARRILLDISDGLRQPAGVR